MSPQGTYMLLNVVLWITMLLIEKLKVNKIVLITETYLTSLM
jgi:hypothetical protein